MGKVFLFFPFLCWGKFSYFFHFCAGECFLIFSIFVLGKVFLFFPFLCWGKFSSMADESERATSTNDRYTYRSTHKEF
jgi:hypothetical protein